MRTHSKDSSPWWKVSGIFNFSWQFLCHFPRVSFPEYKKCIYTKTKAKFEIEEHHWQEIGRYGSWTTTSKHDDTTSDRRFVIKWTPIILSMAHHFLLWNKKLKRVRRRSIIVSWKSVAWIATYHLCFIFNLIKADCQNKLRDTPFYKFFFKRNNIPLFFFVVSDRLNK